MDDTTDQLDDDADARLEEPTKIATGIVQGEGNDAEMTEAQQGNENLETTQEQVVEDAHVTISTVPKKTEVPVTSSSRSSDLASKFLNFSDIPQTDAEIVSPLDVHVHHEVPRTQAPTLLTIPVLVIPESSLFFTNIPQSSHTFTPTPIQATRTPLPTIKTTNPLSNLLDFALHGRKDKDKDEDPSVRSDRGLKNRKTRKDAEPNTEEPMFKVADSDTPHDQEGNLGDNEDEANNETASRRDWFKKPTPPQEPTDPN
ncbi:hypothetical protein Tco_0451805 [Tanacetum coccineum]